MIEYYVLKVMTTYKLNITSIKIRSRYLKMRLHIIFGGSNIVFRVSYLLERQRFTILRIKH